MAANQVTLIVDKYRKRPPLGFIGYYVFDTSVPFAPSTSTWLLPRRRRAALPALVPNLLTSTLFQVVNVTSAWPRRLALMGAA